MVPLSERRHRLYDQEIPEAIKGLVLRLRQLLEKREDRESAETAFRALYRLTNPEDPNIQSLPGKTSNCT